MTAVECEKYEEVGKRLIDTINKQTESLHLMAQPSTNNAVTRISNVNQQRTQIHSIESASVKDIFIILNNMAVIFMKMKRLSFANILMNCSI